MQTKKLKNVDIKSIRLELLQKQGGLCAICKLPCSVEEAVLDHCHKGGHIRAVLHRGCNSAEGKVVNGMRRYGVKDPMTFLKGLLEYHEYHSQNQTGLIHPSYFTLEEKKERLKKKAKRKKDAILKARIKTTEQKPD